MPRISAPVKKKTLPVHRWENGFELHGLPELPAPALEVVRGRGVLGLLGGTGKTTALLILSGRLDPSCGWYSLIQRYGGTSLGGLLKKLDGDELVTSYKPQAVERLRHLPDLKRNLSDLNLDFDLVHALRIGGYETKDIEKLNANELQRVSIAAALSKNAELYLLDEPSQHLDIGQRFRVAKLIREKGKQAPVIVADSDLTFLRLACSGVSIFYGDENWCTPSKAYDAKEAINAFAGGVLPDGIRIHPKSKPGESPAQREKRFVGQNELLFELAGVQRRFGENVLQADGQIMKNERIGILGADGSGKSTLLGIIAGKEEFSGLMRGKFTVSYKSQHLSQHDVLKGVPKEMLKMLGIPLRGRPILSQSLRQRIAIARCLGTKADLYVLDQPTDGLTAEERLAVAELLRSKPSVIIADNDAWFLARVSDRTGLVVSKNGRSSVEWLSAEDAIGKIMTM